MLNKTTNKNDNASFGKPGGYQQHIAIPKALCNDVHVGAFQSQSNMKFERKLFSRHSLTGLDFCNHRQPSATVQSMFQMLEWITWCINEWVSDRVSEQVNGWLGGWMIDWLIDWSIDWMNEWMNEWLNEWMNEWMNAWMNEWINESMNQWINERMKEWMDEWINESMNEWMKEWMMGE